MLRVVLADDEKKVILLLQKLIRWESMGYEIVGVAQDGVKALELVREMRPDLLITDIRMPGCSGIELIRQAKELQPELHFIIISGYRQFEYAQSALKYGVEDYLLKPIQQEELNGILLRLKEKLNKENALAYQLKRSGEQLQEQMIDALCSAAERQAPFCSAKQANAEYGVSFGDGSCFAVVLKPDLPNADQYLDGYRLMMQHLLKITRREVARLTDSYVAAVRREGVVVLLCFREYQTMEIRNCFTRIRREMENQRDLFWDIRITICMGSRKTRMESLSDSMREALWLCSDRLCRFQIFRDAETEEISFSDRYQMDAAQKKRFQDAIEYLDTERFDAEVLGSYHALLMYRTLNGQIVTDWFSRVLAESLYGLRLEDSEDFEETMWDEFWLCMNVRDVLWLLQKSIGGKLRQLREEKVQSEGRPITQAKKYIQQHYREGVRLEDVSRAVGFNATYFSVLFKKETGRNFMDYLTDLRISKAKELLCDDALSIQDVAEQVGYHDLKYFSRLFKKTTGVSPSDYKKLYR